VLRSETVSGPATSSDQFSQLLAQLADKVATGLCAASQPPPPPQALSGTLNVEITTKAAGVPPIQQNRTTVSTGHFPITYRRDYYDPTPTPLSTRTRMAFWPGLGRTHGTMGPEPRLASPRGRAHCHSRPSTRFFRVDLNPTVPEYEIHATSGTPYVLVPVFCAGEPQDYADHAVPPIFDLAGGRGGTRRHLTGMKTQNTRGQTGRPRISGSWS
jgi:hypothetical protein